MSASDLHAHASSSGVLTKGIYVRPGGELEENEVSIECNWCYGEDSYFYRGDVFNLTDTDWLAIAVEHLTSKHEQDILDLDV